MKLCVFAFRKRRRIGSWCGSLLFLPLSSSFFHLPIRVLGFLPNLFFLLLCTAPNPTHFSTRYEVSLPLVMELNGMGVCLAENVGILLLQTYCGFENIYLFEIVFWSTIFSTNLDQILPSQLLIRSNKFAQTGYMSGSRSELGIKRLQILKMAATFASRCSRVSSVALRGFLILLLCTLTIATLQDDFVVQKHQQRTFIQMRTVLKVVDNSGAKKVMCIQALKGKKGARLGDTIIASVKEAHPNGKVKKGKVVYGVVVRAAMQKGRCDGSEVKFDDNAVVLVDKQGQPIGTRVFGPVPHELRQKKHVKILTLAGHIA
ncbi:50S ribosomal protein HLP, mitochondrial, partial [Mucuna pruriens]